MARQESANPTWLEQIIDFEILHHFDYGYDTQVPPSEDGQSIISLLVASHCDEYADWRNMSNGEL